VIALLSSLGTCQSGCSDHRVCGGGQAIERCAGRRCRIIAVAMESRAVKNGHGLNSCFEARRGRSGICGCLAERFRTSTILSINELPAKSVALSEPTRGQAQQGLNPAPPPGCGYQRIGARARSAVRLSHTFSHGPASIPSHSTKVGRSPPICGYSCLVALRVEETGPVAIVPVLRTAAGSKPTGYVCGTAN